MAVANYLNVVWGAKDNGFNEDAKKKLGFFSSMKESITTLTGLWGNFNDQGGTLMTSFELALRQAQGTTKKLQANYGLVGDNFKSVAKDAQEINTQTGISTDNAAKSIINFNMAKKAFEAIGIKTAQELAKYQEVTNIDPERMRALSAELTGRLKMNTKEVELFFKSIYGGGAAMGDLGGMLKEIPEILQQMTTTAHAQGSPLNAATINDLAKQYSRLAGSTNELLGLSDAKKSLGFVQDLTKGFYSAKKGLEGLTTGTQTELPDFVKALQMATTSAQHSFRLMAKGPQEFLEGMGDMWDQMTAHGRDTKQIEAFIRNNLVKQSGMSESNVDLMIEIIKKGKAKIQGAISGVDERIGKSKGIRGTLSAYTDVRDQQVILDTYVEKARAKLRGNFDRTEEYLKGATKSLNEFGVSAKKLMGDKDSAIGYVIEGLVEVDKMGTKAFLPEKLQKFVPQMQLMDALVKNVGIAFSGLGLDLSKIKGPLDIVEAGFKGLTTIFSLELYKSNGNIGKAIVGTIESIIHGFKNATHMGTELIRRIRVSMQKQMPELEKAVKEISKLFSALWDDDIEPVLQSMWSWVVETAKPYMIELGDMIGTAVSDGIIKSTRGTKLGWLLGTDDSVTSTEKTSKAIQAVYGANKALNSGQWNSKAMGLVGENGDSVADQIDNLQRAQMAPDSIRQKAMQMILARAQANPEGFYDPNKDQAALIDTINSLLVKMQNQIDIANRSVLVNEKQTVLFSSIVAGTPFTATPFLPPGAGVLK